MYLKRLDLQGFKSFPEKISLEFNKGITTVVGPNGSGKSNISDSIRWVLGEQKVKTLRGDKMEDVIFSGTANRKPLGFAEVSLTLDNEDHKIPLDFTDIKVTRTVYRSGESRYMINGTVCRLKDIHELFMDTGVGREGYSIIGQGRIDEILSSKSEDRRHLFEEAAGIVKYRTRRSEAISKLEKEQQNLLRVEDIILELESKVEPLKTQSEVAKKYLSLKEQLKKYEVNNFCLEADKLQNTIEKIKEVVLISQFNIEEEKKQYDSNKELIVKNKEQEEKCRAELQKLNDVISSLASELERIEGEIKLCVQEALHIEVNFNRLDEEKALKEKKIEELKEEEEAYLSRIKVVEESISSLKIRLEEEQSNYDRISRFLSQGEDKIERYKSDAIEKIKISTEINSNMQRLSLMKEQFTARYQQLSNEYDYIESQISESEARISVLEKFIEEKTKLQNSLNEELRSLEQRKEILSRTLDDKTLDFNEKFSKLNEYKSKLKVLNEMKSEFEGFFKSVKSILKLRGRHNFVGICGAIGELIKVEKKYETAIEIAVGQAMQNIVTETEKDAKIAIEYLRKNNLGRATFLPLSVIKNRDLTKSDKDELISVQGVHGIAKELITYDSKYENIISSILGRVVIVESMEHALSLAKKTGYKYKLVTVDGDVVNPGGTMTGGSTSQKSLGIFGRNREINELEEKINNFEKQIKLIKSEINKCNISLSEDAEKTIEINKNIQQTQFSIVSMQQELIQCNKSVSEKRERLESISLERETLVNQIETANIDIRNKEAELKKNETEIEEINNVVEGFLGTVRNEKSQMDEILKNLTDIKVSISSIEQEKHAALENVTRIKNEQKRTKDEIESLEKQKIELKDLNSTKSKEKLKFEDLFNIAKERKNSFEVFKEQMNDRLSLIRAEELSLQEKSQLHFETINKLESDVFKSETKLEKLNEDVERLYSQVWEDYELTYQKAKEMFDETISVSDIQTVTKQLKGEIKALGTVNVNSIDEYKEVSERYNFLTEQRDDIRNAEDKLQKIIDDLAVMMRERFKEQFEIINKNFNIVFKEMFGGGTAYLKMDDESNILESGIEIVAQPPGKSLQNMMLLSGGERALTAIAILFAILKMKPSPFCILDEIEAALDDANVKRFANYLKDFSDGTQFILITHRKGTMEAADVMYGVTMQEQGVSKIISVKFDDEAV